MSGCSYRLPFGNVNGFPFGSLNGFDLDCGNGLGFDGAGRLSSGFLSGFRCNSFSQPRSVCTSPGGHRVVVPCGCQASQGFEPATNTPISAQSWAQAQRRMLQFVEFWLQLDMAMFSASPRLDAQPVP